LIQHDYSPPRGLQNLPQRFRLNERARRIVGVRQKKYTWVFAKSGTHVCKRKPHLPVVPTYVNASARYFRPVAIHRKGRFASQDGRLGSDKGEKKPEQGVLSSIGQKKFFWPTSQQPRNASRRSLVLGINSELLRSHFRQGAQYSRAATGCIFVEIEAD